MSDDELRRHAEQVAAWGGRVTAPAEGQKVMLGDTSLGNTHTFLTTGSAPISAEPITLAEMTVSKPISVDVTFSYPNKVPVSGVLSGTIGAEGANGENTVDTGNGFVRITWGIEGAQVQQSVDCDGANGWRYPFVASHLIVQYFPVDRDNENIISVNQRFDLQVSAQIQPSSGAPCLPLQRTNMFPDLAANGFGQRKIPKFAAEWNFQAALFGADQGSASMFGRLFATFPQFIGSDGDADLYPTWILQSSGWNSIPSIATFMSVGAAVANSFDMLAPSVVFRLAV